MSWVGAAIGGSAVLGFAGSNKAAGAQEDAARDATTVQREALNTAENNNAPSQQAGYGALNQLSYGLGINIPKGAYQREENFDAKAYLAANPDVADPAKWGGTPWQHYAQYGQKEGRDFPLIAGVGPTAGGVGTSGPGFGEFNKKFSLADYQEDPGYKFRLDQGSQALERSAAARGGLLSGGHLKDLTGYQQSMASQEYGNAYNRFNNDQSSRFNRLATLAGIGQTTNNTLATLGQNTANNISNNITGAGNAQAAGYIGGVNAANNAVGQGLSIYQNNQLLKSLAPRAA